MRASSLTSILVIAVSTVLIAQQRPNFEVASVKSHKSAPDGPRDFRRSYGPQGVNFIGMTLTFLIGEAYNFPLGQIVVPDALRKETLLGEFNDGYDVAANAERPVAKAQMQIMLQALLADRFKL